jgi:hypothetical protein
VPFLRVAFLRVPFLRPAFLRPAFLFLAGIVPYHLSDDESRRACVCWPRSPSPEVRASKLFIEESPM